MVVIIKQQDLKHVDNTRVITGEIRKGNENNRRDLTS